MIKVILQAKHIPLDSKVTKRTGEKIYTLRNRIRVFNETGAVQEIKAQEDARFIVAENGDTNAIDGACELVWHADPDMLQDFLYGDDK